MVKVKSSSKSGRKVLSQSELARHLGLSDWTVSRAINGHPAVKESTRKRVLKAMCEFGFQQDPLALGLRGKKTGLIGVTFNELRNSILLEKLAVFERFLHGHGLRSVLAVSDQNEESETQIITDFRRLRVDAVVLVQSTLSEKESLRILGDLNVVHIDPIVPQKKAVMVDRNYGMELLIDHLYALGHRQFGTMGILEINNWRWQGLIRALAKYQLTPEQNLKQFLVGPNWTEEPDSYAAGIEMAEQVLADPTAPTALIALNDRVALGAAQHLIYRGASVPGRFSVTGFDHLEVSRCLRPKLTTIDHQPEQLMEAAGKALIEQLQDSKEGEAPQTSQKQYIQPLLVTGDSTGPIGL